MQAGRARREFVRRSGFKSGMKGQLMNTLTLDKRRRRNKSASFEALDDRIAPTAMGVGALAALRAEVRAEAAAELRIRNEARLARIERQSALREAALARSAARVDPPASAPRVTPNQVGRLVSIINLGSLPRPSIASATPSPAPLPPTGVTIGPPSRPPVVVPVSPITPAPTTPTTPGSTTLPVNVPPILATIYQEYEAWVNGGEQGPFTTPKGPGQVEVQGTSVGIDVHDGNPGDFAALGAELSNLGMQIVASDATHGTYAGFLPITQLPALAELPQMPNLSPMLYPELN
jgi:hypothetical protein